MGQIILLVGQLFVQFVVLAEEQLVLVVDFLDAFEGLQELGALLLLLAEPLNVIHHGFLWVPALLGAQVLVFLSDVLGSLLGLFKGNLGCF